MKNFEYQEHLCREQKPGACRIVIFGASGDLAKRKLFPSLAALDAKGLLAKESRITGCARSTFDDAAFRSRIKENLSSVSKETEERFLNRIHYISLDYNTPEDYMRLAVFLQQELPSTPVIFYLALPPTLYPAVLCNLDDAGLLNETPDSGARRIVFEKPFGFNLKDALALEHELRSHLEESQIYRIDHYLGKETVQNIFLLRFANRIFEPLWNAEHIESIQITVAETLGVENRAGYFDQAGILRDMFQNHLLEMLSLVTMECPSSFAADAVRDEKVKLIRSIRKIDFADAVRAQYQGYLEEPGIAPQSRTETFVALRLFIDNWRWQGVPVYLRAGKKLGVKKSEIDICFKPVPHSIFPGIGKEDLQPDILHLHIQPQEGISLTIQAKKPGPKLCMGALTLNYDYSACGGEALDAYARLLLDVQTGDQTLFIRSDAIESSWKLYQPLLDHWAADTQSPLPGYAQNSSGPKDAEKLLERDTRQWNDQLMKQA